MAIVDRCLKLLHWFVIFVVIIAFTFFYIKDEVSRLSHQYNLPLRISHNKARGFYIQIPEESLKTYTKTSSSKVSYGTSTLSNDTNFLNENIFIEAEEEAEEEEDEQQGNIQACKTLHRTNRNTVHNKYPHRTLTTSELSNSPVLQNLPDEFKKPFISKNVVHCTTDSLVSDNMIIVSDLCATEKTYYSQFVNFYFREFLLVCYIKFRACCMPSHDIIRKCTLNDIIYKLLVRSNYGS